MAVRGLWTELRALAMAVGPLGEVVASGQRVCVAAEVAVISGCCVASHGLGTAVSEWSSAAHPCLRSVD